MKTNLILIRHGETEWNAVRRLQGHTDIALNAQGQHQAAALGLALQQEKLAAIISSDLQRAQQTAQEVARWHNLPLQLDPNLRERCFGGFEGMQYDDLAQRYPAQFAAWHAREPDAVLPASENGNTGETFRQFYQRCLQAIEHWAKRYAGQTIALVAHGGVLECAYRAAGDIPMGTAREFPVLNASINRLTWEQEQEQEQTKLILHSWGDCAHLDTLPMSLDELNQCPTTYPA